MRYTTISLLASLWVVGAASKAVPDTVPQAQVGHGDAFRGEAPAPSVVRNNQRQTTRLPQSLLGQNDPRAVRDTYPINCYLHDWPGAAVESIKQAYSWFYQIASPLEADAQHCRRVACYGSSAVWLCADSLDHKSINSIRIADEMNKLLDGDHGCLVNGNKNVVQGQVFTSEEWNVLVRGGEVCTVDVPEAGIFY
ncbi:hypothetical protein F4777DRAFT_593543 [Nemania sp. FL0916]|nr:hypothetical protein F4777DRAFT_593543 [Nemania sp. FL0916]